jgi:long-chain acyl-CoA synthetase
METMYTSILLCMGIRVAYASPQTLLPKPMESPDSNKKDMIYDLELVHPDMILAVPQTLNEIRKLFERSPCIQLKSFLYVNNQSKPKLCGKNSWPTDGDQVVLKYRLFGGKLKALLVGSAHISTETYNFLKRKLGVLHVVQHYACAEACSCILLDTDGRCIGNGGFPLWGTFVRLIDWPDGGYFVTDKPYPRGEIVIGGDCVSDGYFKESTMNSGVFMEEYGKTWCITGDIGEILPDGSVHIIDRKSDLFKLPSGNFVSPARVELELKSCTIVQNAFVYGKPKCDYIVAIIRPNEPLIMEMAKLLGKSDSFPFLCYDEEIKQLVLHQIRDHCRSRGFFDYEIPERIRLSSHRWTSEVGLLTDFITGGYKPRRYQMREFFKNDLAMMYDC